jgi:hypothetical protein
MKTKWMRVSGQVVAAALLCALGTSGVAAQGQPAVERLEVVFWPEFDSQDMLVIYRISLAETTELPALVSVPIPADVGAPHAVAVSDNEGRLFITPFSSEESGDWVIITLEATTSEARVEYYAELEVEGSLRNFTFDWPGGLEVGEFSYELQQPVGSEEPTIEPPPEAEGPGLYGLNYYFGSMGGLDVDSTAHIQLSYVREQSGLTVDLIQQVPPLSRPEETEGETADLSVILTWLGVGLVGVLIIVGGFMLARIWRTREPMARQRRRQRPKKRPQLDDHFDAATVFCHACGRQAGASDRYCRSCGTQLRR